MSNLHAVEAIRSVLVRYCHACDDGRFDDFEACFASDAVMEVMGETYAGRAAVRDFIEAAQPPDARGKHFLGQPLIVLDDTEDSATAVTDYLFVANTDRGLRITSAGRYADALRLEGDGWLLTRREIIFL